MAVVIYSPLTPIQTWTIGSLHSIKSSRTMTITTYSLLKLKVRLKKMVLSIGNKALHGNFYIINVPMYIQMFNQHFSSNFTSVFVKINEWSMTITSYSHLKPKVILKK